MQAVSTAMLILYKNFLYFAPSPADECMEKRVSYQQVHLAFCTGSATAPGLQLQDKASERSQAKAPLCQDEHVAVISRGRRKESVPAPAVVVCKKIKGVEIYSSTNPSREVLKGLEPEPKSKFPTCSFPLDSSLSLPGETTTQDQRCATEAVF